MLCPKPAKEPEPEDELLELELELDPPPPELEEEPVELDELEELEELDELLDELGELLEELEELELDELLEGVDELLDAAELPVDEPVLDPPGPAGSASAPHPGSGATPASTAPPERRRRKSRRSSRDNCFGERRIFAMIPHFASLNPLAAMILVTHVTSRFGRQPIRPPGVSSSRLRCVAVDRGPGR